MRKLFFILTAAFFLYAIGGCAANRDTLPKPDTNLEFWIAENVDNVDISKYEQKPGMFGGHQFYGTGYAPAKDEDGNNVDPEHCVVYTATSYPDYSDQQVHITGIVITDPDVHFYGLSLGSTFEEFEAVMQKQEFTVTRESEGRYYAQNGKFTVRVDGDSIRIHVTVTNKQGIIF